MRWLAIATLAACSGSSATPDAAKQADAYDTARCLIKGNYGDLGSVTGTAGTVSSATTVTITLETVATGKNDLFWKLVPGKGAFTGGVKAGAYTIGGVDASFNTCGLCTNLIAGITSTGPTKFYFADSGTVTFTSVTPPIAGSAQNLHFAEIDLNSGAPIAGGCTGSITSVSFTTP
jgi:hypothetical protein